MKSLRIAVLVCMFSSLVSYHAFAQQGAKILPSEILGERKECYFDEDEPGQTPMGFESALTGKGIPGKWEVLKSEKATSSDNVVVQTKFDDTENRFPVLVLQDKDYKDAMAYVRFRPETGKIDQAGGLVFRYKDNNNYYVLRGNALENNVRLYAVVNGNRKQIGGQNIRVTPNEWHLLKAVFEGNRIRCYFDNKQVIKLTDDTFDSGSVGIWTKADSYTFFDDLLIQER